MLSFTEELKNNRLLFDGSMGALLSSMGKASDHPELYNIEEPELIQGVHQRYIDAGANVVITDSLGATPLRLRRTDLVDRVPELTEAAVRNARCAVGDKALVALDIGPSGRMLAPLGDLDFEDAVAVFAETVKLGVKYGCDLIFIETMNDCYETKAALLAAKENSDLPVFVSNAYGEDGKLMTGASPAAMVAMLEGMGADAIGCNCSLGPKALAPIVEEYLAAASVPVLLKPNAGLPHVEGGRTVYDVSPADFAAEVKLLIEKGVRIAGGCCGTTPDYIRALTSAASGMQPVPLTDKERTVVSSYTHAVLFGDKPLLIGERINPTGKKRFKEALKANDIDYILGEGIAEQEASVHILDVNVGLPEIDEVKMLTTAVRELQAVIDLPLQIDTSDPAAMEAALRRYNGKAMINSVSGKKESMDAIFPLAKKYGGVIVALTLDEDGIPASGTDRVKIAMKILREAKKYGIKKSDIVFDPLALTVSADQNSAKETLHAVDFIRNIVGCHTSLGVSNVSFGLPSRDIINSAYFTMALASGLSAAIMNPHSVEMMKAYRAYLALSGKDDNCAGYIEFASALPQQTAPAASAASAPAAQNDASEEASPLRRAIIKGLKEQAASLTADCITSAAPLAVVQEEIIPALNIVGMGFEKKTVYLPQLLMAAEAAKAAFEVIKANMPSEKAADKCAFVLATVKGDIHDIGKNIVKLLLENYGFAVTDLGRDVPPEDIVEAAVRLHAPIVGLSALMTTTVPAMEETIKQLRTGAPWCRVVVGGAVLTKDYADAIGADKYAKDAMETVRYAEEIDAALAK